MMMAAFASCSVKATEETPQATKATTDWKVLVLNDAINQGNTAILLSPDPDTLKKYMPESDFPLAVNAVLVQHNDSNFLFDTGVGGKLVANLAAQNVSPENIQKIFITHAHGDHIGGLLADGNKIFPNADLYINKVEHDYWLAEKNPLFLQVIEQYKDRLHLFSLEEMKLSLFPDINAIAAYGHTPGHTMFEVGSGENQTLLWGDLAHVMPIQMPHPEYSVSFDVNPAQAAAVRQEVLKDIAGKNIAVAGMHINGGLGKVGINGAGGYVFEKIRD
jgi:glyoxylase-like metal-dependent hydrolase (beta-lactamase superfamily II)